MQMNVATSVIIALAILLGSAVLSLGGRYQLVPDGLTANNYAWRVDRLTGDVQFCRTEERPDLDAVDAVIADSPPLVPMAVCK
jgi:hypothetical protein